MEIRQAAMDAFDGTLALLKANNRVAKGMTEEYRIKRAEDVIQFYFY